METQRKRATTIALSLLLLFAATVVIAQTESPPRDAQVAPTPWVKVAEASRSALVLIETEKSQGSGFLVRANGTIVTNHHVIAEANEIRVTLGSGEIYRKAHILASDQAADLALLRIEGADLPTLPL